METQLIETPEGFVFSAYFHSKSRKGLIHYTRIVLDSNFNVKKETCSCEGFAFSKKCWHLKVLEEELKKIKWVK